MRSLNYNFASLRKERLELKYIKYKVKVRDFWNILDLKAKLFCLTVYLTVLGTSLHAQVYEDVYILESAGVSISTTHVLRDGNVSYLYGQYFGDVNIGSFSLKHTGSADVFLMKLINNQPEWIFSGGSNGFDKSVDIEMDNNGNLVIGGEFWLEARFGDLTLVTEGSTKSLFVIKLDVDGNVLMDQTINGTGTKNMNGVELIDDDIYINGSFSDSLFISSTTAIAQADQDIYLLKMDRENESGWIQHYGLEGNTDSRDFSWDVVNQQFIVSGEFFGRIVVASDTIAINTFDIDMFIAAFDINGEGLWIEKAGGQFEDFNEAHCLDEEGNIYLTGSYRGIIDFSDGSQINTGGVTNMDAYLIKFSPDGNKIWARTLGGMNTSEFGTSISYEGGRLFWTAYHDGAINIDGIDFLDSESTFNGIMGVYNIEGTLERGFSIIGNTSVIPRGAIPEGKTTFVFGDFQGEVDLDQVYDAPAFASFHANVLDLILSSSNLAKQSIKVYPNPVSQFLHIDLGPKAEHLEIINLQGTILYRSSERKLAHTIDFTGFGSGIYFWRSESGAIGKVIYAK